MKTKVNIRIELLISIVISFAFGINLEVKTNTTSETGEQPVVVCTHCTQPSVRINQTIVNLSTPFVCSSNSANDFARLMVSYNQPPSTFIILSVFMNKHPLQIVLMMIDYSMNKNYAINCLIII